MGKGACDVPTINSLLGMVGTLRFAHPTIPRNDRADSIPRL
jgi:hypothetical protein